LAKRGIGGISLECTFSTGTNRSAETTDIKRVAFGGFALRVPPAQFLLHLCATQRLSGTVIDAQRTHSFAKEIGCHRIAFEDRIDEQRSQGDPVTVEIVGEEFVFPEYTQSGQITGMAERQDAFPLPGHDSTDLFTYSWSSLTPPYCFALISTPIGLFLIASTAGLMLYPISNPEFVIALSAVALFLSYMSTSWFL
jgi:hypothetical protein